MAVVAASPDDGELAGGYADDGPADDIVASVYLGGLGRRAGAGPTMIVMDTGANTADRLTVSQTCTAMGHLIADPLVTVDGDGATCEANFQATHLGTVGSGPAIWTLGGHYRFALARCDDGWRITEPTMTAVWETGTRAVLDTGDPA